MNYYDLPFVMRFCASGLWKYADALKNMDACVSDIRDVCAIYDHIQSFDGDFSSMTLGDLKDTLHRSYLQLDDFVFMLKEDDDPNWRGYEFLMTVLWRFVGFSPMIRVPADL